MTLIESCLIFYFSQLQLKLLSLFSQIGFLTSIQHITISLIFCYSCHPMILSLISIWDQLVVSQFKVSNFCATCIWQLNFIERYHNQVPSYCVLSHSPYTYYIFFHHYKLRDSSPKCPMGHSIIIFQGLIDSHTTLFSTSQSHRNNMLRWSFNYNVFIKLPICLLIQMELAYLKRICHRTPLLKKKKSLF